MQRQYFFIVPILLVLLICTHARLTEAQQLNKPSLITRRMNISSTPHFQSWQLTDRSKQTQTLMTQFAVPWNLNLVLSSRTQVQLTQYHVRSDFQIGSVGDQADIARIDLQGFGDVRAKLSHAVSDSFLILVGASLPIGRRDLNRDESLVSAALFNQSLDFGVGRLGEGAAFDFGSGYVHSFSNATISLGANYLYKGSYQKDHLTVISENPVYDPGQEFSLAAGIDVGKETFQLRSDAVYTYHTAETLDQQNYFHQGPNLLLDTGLAYKKHRIQLEIFGQYLQHWSSRRPDLEGDFDILVRELNNRLVYGISANYRIGQRTSVFGSVSDKLIRTHDNRKFAAIRAYGLNLFCRVAAGLGFTTGVKISDGQIKQRVDLAGLSTYATLTTGF